MKLVCAKGELSKVLGMAQSAVSTKSTLPVLGNVLFEATQEGLFITGTDLDIGLKIKAKVEVVESGSVTIPARKIVDIARKCPDAEIEIVSKNGAKIEIRCGKSRFNIVGISAEDFPNLPSVKKEKGIKIQDGILLRMIKKTSFSVSMEETRRILNGALFSVQGKKARMVSTDGHRLSYIEKDMDSEFEAVSAVVPIKALNEMSKILDGSEETVTVYFTENHLFLEKNGTLLVSRLLDGQFPNYEQVIPKKSDNSFRAAREELTQAVERVSLMASDRTNSIRFSLKRGALTIHSSTPDVGEAEEEMDVDFEGGEMTIAFNARYILEALKAIDGEKVEFHLSSPLAPALLCPMEESADSKFVIMPMRI